MNVYKGTAIFELGDQRIPYQVNLQSWAPTAQRLGQWHGWIDNPDDRIFDYVGYVISITVNGNVGNVFIATLSGKLTGTGNPPF